MAIIGNVDTVDNTQVVGWVADIDRLDDTLIVFALSAGRVVAAAAAQHPRPDLAAQFENTNRGFVIDLSTQLEFENLELRVLPAADAVPTAHKFRQIPIESGIVISQKRWRGTEEAHHLTWGIMLNGSEFFSHVTRSNRTLGRVVEIGPGYGRLLRHMLDNKLAFHSYLGLDISQDRVEKLSSEFGSQKISFAFADVMDYAYPSQFDTLICSSTIEHLYPDASKALAAISQSLSRSGLCFIDFPSFGHTKTFRSQNFMPRDGGFVRFYSEDEALELFKQAGMELVDFAPFAMRAIDAPLPYASEVNEGGAIKLGARVVAVPRFMAIGRKKTSAQKNGS